MLSIPKLLQQLSQILLIRTIFVKDDAKVEANGGCQDKSAAPGLPSDCPSRHQLCDDVLYTQLMTVQCPLTCGRCGLLQQSSDRAACADQIGPNGVSDCPKFPGRCIDPQWASLMAQECPLTCKLCTPAKPSLPLSASLQFFDYPQLLHSLNPAIRPCDDFYSHVCDGYRKAKLPMLQGPKESINSFSELRENAEQAIIDLLTNPLSRERYQANPLFSRAFTFYDACMDLRTRDQDRRPMEALFDELRTVRQRMGAAYTFNTEWLRAVYPILPLDTKIPTFGTQPPLLLPFLAFRPIPFSTARTGQYAGNANVWLYELGFLDPPTGPQADDQYQQMAGILALVFGDDLAMNGAAPLLVPAGTDRTAVGQLASTWIDQMRDIDRQMEPIFERFNSTADAESLTLQQIHQQLSPAIDWPAFLADVDPRLGPNTKVTLKCRQCFLDFGQLLADIGAKSPGQMRDYLEWQIIDKHFHTFDSRYSQLTWGHPIPGLPPRTTIQSICMARTATHFEKHLDRLYIDSHFDERSRARVAQMIEQGRAEFRLMLLEADWMAEPTRRRALQKLERMGSLVGYFPQIRDDRLLAMENSCYDFGSSSSPSYGQMELKASLCTNQRNMEQTLVVDEQQQMLFQLDSYVRSYEPNGLYETSRNIFIVLAAIMQLPLFATEMPEAAQFGGVGILIAHEITHGFDNRGRGYNEQGMLENWWDPATEQQFIQKTRCLVDQYSNYKIRVDERGTEELPVDGQLTLNENIPDNGGLKAAFRRMERNRQQRGTAGVPRQVVRGLERLSDQQLFFVNFAFFFCTVDSAQSARLQLHLDVHSPAQARVNLVVGNSQGFVTAFGCKEGDRMFIRPEQRCQLW